MTDYREFPRAPVQARDPITEAEALRQFVTHPPGYTQTWRWGLLFRPGSCWVGFHWSPANKRLCVNLVPFFTIWITKPGGRTP